MNSVENAAPRYLFPKPYADAVQRLRVASGFILLLTFAWFSHPSVESMAVGIPISLLGLAIRAWAADISSRTSGLPPPGLTHTCGTRFMRERCWPRPDWLLRAAA